MVTNEERARAWTAQVDEGYVSDMQDSLAAEFAAVRRETLEIAAAHIDVPYTTTGQEFAAALRALAADPQGSEE